MRVFWYFFIPLCKNPPTMKPNDFISDLNAINRTYLFFNDRKELEDFTGISFSNNNTAAKASFEKRYTAFHKLADDAKKICGIDLKQLLEIYEEESEFISKNKPSTLRKSNIYNLLDSYIFDDEIADYSLRMTVVLLILTKLLPKFTSHRGPAENLEEDFEKFYVLIDDYCKTTGKLTFGYLDIHRENLQATEPKYLSRILLISIAADVLLTLRNYNNDKCKYVAATKLRNEHYDLTGFYCNYDGDNTRDFWLLEYDDEERKNYFLTHYVKVDEHYEYTIYQMFIRDFRGLNHFTIMSEKYARKCCENGSAEDEETSFWVDFSNKPTNIYKSDDDTIKKLTFDRVSTKGFDINLTELYRVENSDPYVKLIENAVLTTDPKFLYTKSGKLTAITEDYLYFDLPDDVRAALNTNQTSIKIRRENELACYESINSDVCFAVFGDGAVYLAFYHLNKFYDVRKFTVSIP